MDDVLIVGGGVIGLSLAWELAGRGVRVHVLERGEPGREASWAGAGILPPANEETARHPYDRLAGLSHRLHPGWARRLLEETGVDNGYRVTGGWRVARDETAAKALEEMAADWRRRQIRLEPVALEEVRRMEPALTEAGRAAKLAAAWLAPDEAQIRNPRHLKALAAACRMRGAGITAGVAVHGFRIRGERVAGVETSTGVVEAGAVCVCSGAWSQTLLAALGATVRIEPVRGQIVLLDCEAPTLRRIVNEGPRYLVPRPDGRVLVGSTEERAGFDKRTTAAGVEGLLRFALELAPGLKGAAVERTWAGLRPGTADGLPCLGAAPGWENAYICAGHFRGGLALSPGSAVVMADSVCGQVPPLDLTPFAADR